MGTLHVRAAGENCEFVQELGAVGGKDVGNVGWDGQELVAVRLHIPSRVTYHNAPSRLVERGNILSWEQPLKARLAGEPLRVEVRFGVQRILVLTVALFLAAMAAAAVTVGGPDLVGGPEGPPARRAPGLGPARRWRAARRGSPAARAVPNQNVVRRLGGLRALALRAELLHALLRARPGSCWPRPAVPA